MIATTAGAPRDGRGLLFAGIALLVLAYVLLVPGLTQPMLTVTGEVARADLIALGRRLVLEGADLSPLVLAFVERFIDSVDTRGTVEVFDKTQSILETAETLRREDHVLVAMLILVFSVGVPLVKALLLLAVLLPLGPRARGHLLAFANASSKWSMVDVFVIGILVAFLAANALGVNESLVAFEARLGPGFACFTAYCLISIAGTQVFCAGLRQRLPAGTPARA